MGVMTIQIQATLAWMAKPNSRGTWIGICDALGLALEAPSSAELRDMIEETHHTLFLDLLEDGELADFLRDRGWTTTAAVPLHPPREGIRFDVPYQLQEAVA